MKINIKKIRKLFENSQSYILEKKNNYMYHGIFIPALKDISPVLSILENGILSIHELKKIGIDKSKICHTSNGNYYICLSSDKDHSNRVFDIGFIIEKSPDFIKADKKSKIVQLLWNTPIPLRSGLKNEYQVFGSISPDKIVGIQLRFSELLKEIPSYLDISEIEYVLRIIRTINSIYSKIEEKKYLIPIINASDNKIIDKNIFKEYNKIITLILDIIKNIPNIGDNYIFQDYISRDYDEIFNFLGCIIERNDTQKSAIITRIKPENELEDWYFNNYTSKIKK